LKSFFLDGLQLAEAPARALAIRPSAPVPAAQRRSLQEKRVLDAILKRHRAFAPTAVEEYLQCPFRFFSRVTLALREAPAPPEDRLTPAAMGGLMHRVIDRWHRDGGDLQSLLSSNWQALLARLKIPPTWRTAILWLLLERSAKHYAAKAAPMPGWKVDTELDLGLEIDGFRFAGRADRVDRDNQGRARVLELKFVGSTGLKKREGKVEEGLSIQAPLYARALQEIGYSPEAYSIVAIRGDTIFSTFEDPEQVRAGMDLASSRASAAAYAITQGDIRVMPADEDLCSFCSYRDACRKREERATQELAAGTGENG
jgi:ATP-dependent helicase/DNAse subunit B